MVKNRTPWYNNKLAVILSLILFFPLGLYGLWKNQRFSRITKYAWTAAILISVIMYGLPDKQDPKNDQTLSPTTAKKQVPQPQDNATTSTTIIVDVSGKNETQIITEPKSADSQKKISNPIKRFDEDNPAVIQARAELKALYKELMSFKDQHHFHNMGFGRGNRQTSAWLDQVKSLNGVLSPKQYPVNLCVAANDLQLLGLEYMRNKGQETTYSKNITPSIKSEF